MQEFNKIFKVFDREYHLQKLNQNSKRVLSWYSLSLSYIEANLDLINPLDYFPSDNQWKIFNLKIAFYV